MLTVGLTAADGTSVVLPAVEVPPARVYTPTPAPSLDGTGVADETATLQAFLDALPAGARTVFAPGRYRVDGTLLLSGRSDVVFDGCQDAGVSFFTDVATTSRTRAFLRLSGCTRVGVERVAFVGPNVNAGTGSAAYVAALEAQHFVDITGTASADCWVSGCTASMIYGDFTYVGAGSHGITVSGNDFHNNGRQGVSVCDGYDVAIVRNRIDQVRRSWIDLEPASTAWSVRDVLIAGNYIGAARLTGVASRGDAAPVDGITIVGNSGPGALTIDVAAGGGFRRRNWLVADNRDGGWGGPAGMAKMSFTNVDGVTVRNNVSPLQAGRGDVLVKCTGCTGVDVSGNQFPGGASELVTS